MMCMKCMRTEGVKEIRGSGMSDCPRCGVVRVDYDNSKVVYSKVVDGSNPNCHITVALKDNGKIVLDVVAIDESQVKENFDKIIEMYNEISGQVLMFKECPNCGIPAEHLQAEYHKSGFECGRCCVKVPYKFELDGFKTMLKKLPDYSSHRLTLVKTANNYAICSKCKKELDPKYRVGGNVYNCPNCGLEESIK